MISNAPRTPRQLKRSLLPNHRQRSLPCSTRRRVWWSHRVLGNTLSRRLNSASTCQINKYGGAGVVRCVYHKLNRKGHFDWILSAVLKDLRTPGMPGTTGSGGLRTPIWRWKINGLHLKAKTSHLPNLRTDLGSEKKDDCNFSTRQWCFTTLLLILSHGLWGEQTPSNKTGSMSAWRGL